MSPRSWDRLALGLALLAVAVTLVAVWWWALLGMAGPVGGAATTTAGLALGASLAIVVWRYG